MNGVGKSTVSKVLSANEEDYGELASFEYYEKQKPEELKPRVSNPFNNVAVFNQAFVDEHLFQKSSLVKGGFEMVLRTDERAAIEKDMRALLAELASRIGGDDVDKLIQKLADVVDCIKAPTKDGTINKKSACYGALCKGNILVGARSQAPEFEPYLAGDVLTAVSWTQWHVSQGIIGQICPYCGLDLDEVRTSRIGSLNEVLAGGDSKKLKQTLSSLHAIAAFLEPSFVSAVNVACSSETGIDNDADKMLADLGGKCEKLLRKLRGLGRCQDLARDSCAMNDAVSEHVKALFISEDDFSFLNEDGRAILKPALDSCEQFEEKQNDLNTLGLKQRRMFERSVRGREAELNQFLMDAGCPYEIKISRQAGSDLTLVPVIDGAVAGFSVDDPSAALSQGEKNVIALALFVYATVYAEQEYDLVVLDDPISSFDVGKRDAILKTFFADPTASGSHIERNLFGFTTLMFTHDFPVLASVVLMGCDLGGPKAYYLWRNANGELGEKSISSQRDFSSKDGLQYFERLQLSKARCVDKHILLRLVAARRLLEVQGYGEIMQPSDDYYARFLAYEVISSLLHKRVEPDMRLKNNPKSAIDGFPDRRCNSDYDNAASVIEEILQLKDPESFDYAAVYRLTSNEKLKKAYEESSSDWDRLQFCRIALDGTDVVYQEPILYSLLDESMHVSGDYLYQLDPDRFEIVPLRAIEWCKRKMGGLG